MIPISPEFNLHMLLFLPNPERRENPEKGAEVAARHTHRQQSADQILQEFISTGNHLVWWGSVWALDTYIFSSVL